MSELAQSEVVFLRGTEFAPPGGRLTLKVTPLGSDVALSAPELGRAILRTALLTNEQAGALSFAEGTRGESIGLDLPVLAVHRGDVTPEWPGGSLESRILTVLDDHPEADGGLAVSGLVYALFEKDSPAPTNTLIDWVNRGLIDRGLVETVETRKWRFFRSTHYELPDATRAMIDDGDVAEAHRLLAGAENARPEFWALLNDQIDIGLRSRIETPDMSRDWDTDWD